MKDAYVSASNRGCERQLREFGSAILLSKAVLARSLGTLHSLAESENQLYVSYHAQVRSGARLPEVNDWDRGRTAAESTIHPNYHEEICYTALSLDGFGLLCYGEYSVTLKNEFIAHRSSAFEENPFTFCRKHHVVAGQQPPPGYRAPWQRRNLLAEAKLQARILPGTKPFQFANILMEQGTSTSDADCIEVHTYGRLNQLAIQRVIGPKPTRPEDGVLWRSLKRKLEKIGAEVIEV